VRAPSALALVLALLLCSSTHGQELETVVPTGLRVAERAARDTRASFQLVSRRLEEDLLVKPAAEMFNRVKESRAAKDAELDAKSALWTQAADSVPTTEWLDEPRPSAPPSSEKRQAVLGRTEAQLQQAIARARRDGNHDAVASLLAQMEKLRQVRVAIAEPPDDPTSEKEIDSLDSSMRSALDQLRQTLRDLSVVAQYEKAQWTYLFDTYDQAIDRHDQNRRKPDTAKPAGQKERP
jgi:hypothetical protein